MLDIGIVANLNLHRNTDAVVRVGKILDDVADHILIWNDDLGPAQCSKHGIACRDPANGAGRAVIERNQVAKLNRAVEQDDETADIITGDFLQAEAQPDCQRTAEDGQRRDVDTDQRQADQQGHKRQQRLGHTPHHLAQIGIQAAGQHQPAFDQATDPQGKQQGNANGRHTAQQHPCVEPLLADDDANLPERLDHRRPQSRHIEGHDAPDHDGHETLDNTERLSANEDAAQHINEHVGQ